MQRSVRAQISAVRTKHPKFSVALIGAATIGAFSILGGACAATPVSGPAAVPLAAAAVVVQTPTVTRLPVATPTTAPTPTTASTPTAASTPTTIPPPVAKPAVRPAPAHVVVVLEENRTLTAAKAPYLAALRRHGADYVNAYAESSYLAIFAGATSLSGATHDDATQDDSCPATYSSPNLGAQLITAGRTFTGYAQSMPRDGYRGCAQGEYTRTHTPWTDFSTVPKASNRKFTHFPQNDFDQLPTVSFVTPDLCSDMYDCGAATGDSWLKTNLSAYATWAKTHNSLLMVAFESGEGGQVPLIVYGQAVRTGTYSPKVGDYSILRTIEDAYGLPCLGHACAANPLPGLSTP